MISGISANSGTGGRTGAGAAAGAAATIGAAAVTIGPSSGFRPKAKRWSSRSVSLMLRKRESEER